jgi:hypothetical protein
MKVIKSGQIQIMRADGFKHEKGIIKPEMYENCRYEYQSK